MSEYAGVFIIVFLAVVAAIALTGYLSTGKPHLGIPDQ